jgi:RNA polymerase sigma factor for flagellar operon FliA
MTAPRPDLHRDAVIVALLPKAKAIAWRYGKQAPVPVEEVEGAVMLALVEILDGADLSDPGLEAYVGKRLQGAAIDFLRRSSPTSRLTYERSRTLGQARAGLTQQLGRTPSDAEMAEALELSVDEFHQLRHRGQKVEETSTSQPISDREGSTLLAQALPAPPVDVDRLVDIRRVRGLVARLPDQERRVMLELLDGKTMLEVGAMLGVSEPRISQIKRSAVARLTARSHQDPRPQPVLAPRRPPVPEHHAAHLFGTSRHREGCVPTLWVKTTLYDMILRDPTLSTREAGQMVAQKAAAAHPGLKFGETSSRYYVREVRALLGVVGGPGKTIPKVGDLEGFNAARAKAGLAPLGGPASAAVPAPAPSVVPEDTQTAPSAPQPQEVPSDPHAALRDALRALIPLMEAANVTEVTLRPDGYTLTGRLP